MIMKISFIILTLFQTTISQPQSNPNRGSLRPRIYRNSSDPSPFEDAPYCTSGPLNDVCDMKSIAAATSEQLPSVIKATNIKCIYNISSLDIQHQNDVCTEGKVKSIADTFAKTATTYDPNDLNFIVYLRICYYLSFNGPVRKFNADLLTTVRCGIDTFLKLSSVDAQNDNHYVIFYNLVNLISNTKDCIHYVDQVTRVFHKISNSWKFTPPQGINNKIDQTDVVNAMLQMFYFSHTDKETKVYYCTHSELPQVLSDFMDKHKDLVNTPNEYILRNAGGELARFLKYKCMETKLDGLVKWQLKQYTSNKAPKVWLTLMVTANKYGSKNSYGGSKVRVNTDLEKQIIKYQKSCNKTYTDTFIIRAQNMTDSMAVDICGKLKSHEGYFHSLVNDSWRPLTSDYNDKIEIVVFNNVDDYKYYANLIYGVDTNNGGIYMEGDPSKPGNIARYFCFIRNNSVWNLLHEFTHYLDGRYNMKGNFQDYNGGRRIWWLEGFAQYAAYKATYPNQSQLCKSQKYLLSQVFSNTYSFDAERVYDYGYLAARYMFEKHRSDVDTLLKYFRSGQYSQYENWFNGIYTRYDLFFKTWCNF